jgi:hypothetical protein
MWTLLLLVACRPDTKGPTSERRADTDAPLDTSVETLPGDTATDTAAPGPDVRINEVMADNDATLEDGDGDSPDWIELFALADVDLEGWGLTDDADEPYRYALPARTLRAGEFLVVYASGKGADGPVGELHAPFSIDAAGETLTLARPDGSVADALDVPALGVDASWGPEQAVVAETPIADGTAARYAATLPDGWTAPAFDDAAWTAVTLGVGFDGEVTAGDPVNAAFGQATSQSSDGYGFTGAQAVDGEPSTFSHTGDADLDPWWQVDLGADYAVEGVTVMNRLDCCPERLYNLTVQLLDADGAPVWASDVLNPVSEGATPTDPGDVFAFTPDSPVYARFARLEKVAVNGAYSSEWLSMGEVVVTGTLASPYAARIRTEVPSAGGVRVPVTVGAAPSRATLTIAYDDAFRMYVDGVEAAATELVGHDGGTASFVLDPALFPPGDHVVAFEALTVDPDDLLLAPTLVLEQIASGEPALFATPTPGAPNGEGVDGRVSTPTVEPPRGFHDTPFTATLTTDTPDATIVYTLDGTEPTLENGTVGTEVEVPTTATLRVAAFRDGWAASAIATHTYLFLADVVRQPAAPEGLPTTWDGISEAPVSGDYEMDPEIVDDPAYAADLLAGLREIPTLSVVMDPDDLWGPDGIYVNSAERGDAYERPASIEWILPDGTTGFAETCGLRIHGYGWRYHSATKKHSFRLEFSRTYGQPKLEYPVFADAPVEKFDSIVLRAGGSKTWLDFRDPANAQYLHDSFARDTARDMGKIDGHATYVHLYLNGLYWGLYNPVERPEAGFGEEYFGGDDEDYDAINRRTVTNEAVDGTLEAYNELLRRADEDLTASYAAVEDMLDVDDLIDYMLIHQYTVNRDGPCCAESNNMRGLRKREDGAQFRFFVWDMEYSLWDATDATNVAIDVAGSISHVYARLQTNSAFRVRYAERARLHLTDGGALTPAVAAARYEARADEIANALVAESARWGDTYRDAPYTRDVEWQAEYDRLMTAFFPRRTDELIAQLRAVGLYE